MKYFICCLLAIWYQWLCFEVRKMHGSYPLTVLENPHFFLVWLNFEILNSLCSYPCASIVKSGDQSLWCDIFFFKALCAMCIFFFENSRLYMLTWSCVVIYMWKMSVSLSLRWVFNNVINFRFLIFVKYLNTLNRCFEVDNTNSLTYFNSIVKD